MNEEQPEGKGALIGSIIVIVLLVAGAFYLINDRSPNAPKAENQPVTQEQQLFDENADLGGIETDLGAATTDISALDEDVKSLDTAVTAPDEATTTPPSTP